MLASLKLGACLLARTLTPDGGGGFTESWQSVGTLWAEITPLGASQSFGPDCRETRVRHRITTRARPDILAGMRIATQTRRFAIRAVLAREAESPVLTLLCEELP